MTLEERHSAAIKACGGAAGLLALPQEIKEILMQNLDLETKTLMLEMVAEQMKKG